MELVVGQKPIFSDKMTCRKDFTSLRIIFSDRKPIYLHQGALVSPFSLEVLQHILSHLDSLPVNQVELILLSFGSSPKIPPMSFKLSLLTTHLLPGGSSAHDIEGWDLVDVVLPVECPYPLVYGGHLVPPVDIGGAALTIVRKPDQFWRRQEWRHSKGVTPTWVKLHIIKIASKFTSNPLAQFR